MAGRLPSRLVIELTEQDAVLNNALLRERLRPWIARGALVAVDDAGAGFTSLEYVAEIRPDFLKLSRGMVAGSTATPAARPSCAPPRPSPARSARAIVAEGVERPEELEALRAMEIDYGQGWLFGRPGAAWPSRTRPRRAAAAGRARSARPARARPCARAATSATPARRSPITSRAAGCCPASTCRPGRRARCQAVARLLAGL